MPCFNNLSLHAYCIYAANIVQIYGSLFYLFFALFHLKQLIKHVFTLLHCRTPINSQVTKCQIQFMLVNPCIVRCLPINFMNSQIYSNTACVKLLQKTRLYEPYPCEDRSFLSVDFWQPGIEQKVGMVANVSL